MARPPGHGPDEDDHLKWLSVRTGVMPTEEQEGVHEYGRLLNLHYFGEIDDDELKRAKKRFGIERPEQEERAEKVAVVYRYLELQNRRDYKGIEELHHDPYINKTYFGRHPISPKAHTRTLRGYFKLFPDATTEGTKILAAEGNTVIVRTTARGTQVGEIPGSLIGQAGKQVAVTLIHAIEVIDGMIAACESTSPFVNQWEQEIVTGSFPGTLQDVSDGRARQGIDTKYELMLERLARSAEEGGLFSEEDLADVRKVLELGPNQCQALMEQDMHRCSQQAAAAALYCDHHQEHGYGID